MTPLERARRVLGRADALGVVSEEDGCLTRRFATPALGEASTLLEGWLREAGLRVERDPVGNVLGRNGVAGVPLVLGSHVDTVRDAGRYDGVLGVLCAIEVAEALGDAAGPLQVAAFADEEGARYGVSYLGSSAFRGRFDPRWLELEDADGVAMGAAIADARGSVDDLRDPRLQEPDLGLPPGAAVAPIRGYLEVHIEQGPVLERAGLPVGVVTAIAGQTRGAVAFVGRQGHAGTVPPGERADALAGAAELVLAVEAAADARPGLVATVGELVVAPGAANVIPGRAEASLDVRHADDAERLAAVAGLEVAAREIAERRGLGLEWDVLQSTGAVAMDAALGASLERAVAAQDLAVLRLVSGAGHDAAIVGREAPAAMLSVRCAGGVSHSPAEAVALDDVRVALAVLEQAVAELAGRR